MMMIIIIILILIIIIVMRRRRMTMMMMIMMMITFEETNYSYRNQEIVCYKFSPVLFSEKGYPPPHPHLPPRGLILVSDDYRRRIREV